MGVFSFRLSFYKRLDMRIRRVILLLLLPLLINSSALGSNPRVSLLTCESGEELYSIYGHSALRVFWPESGDDYIYNFGMFDFTTPHFYWKFIRGNLKYMLGVQSLDEFLFQYQFENRGVLEQHLNLDSLQTVQIISTLNHLALPENRLYLYRFLRKNCTTELRDLIFETLPPNGYTHTANLTGVTHRELLNNYTDGWTRFGLNLILGSTIDREIDVWDSMFLPETLYNGLTTVKLDDSPLVYSTNSLFVSDKRVQQGSSKKQLISSSLSPLIVALLLAFVIVVSLFFKGRDYLADLLLVIAGGVGLFLIGAISITMHSELFWNYNLLWCNPILIAIPFLTIAGKIKIERVAITLSILMLGVLQLLWAFKIQFFEWSYLVIVLTLYPILIKKLLRSFSK